MTGTTHRKRWLLLLGSTSLIVVIWTIVLPWIGDLQSVRARIEFLESQGVDPSALYYSDLEAMPRLEAAVKKKMSGVSFHRVK